MDKELRERLYWMEEELLDAELEALAEEAAQEDPQPLTRRRGNYAPDFDRMVYGDEAPAAERSAGPNGRGGKKPAKKKGIKGLVFLAFLEILGILAIIGWWTQWLI